MLNSRNPALKCDFCQKLINTAQGLKSHITRLHKDQCGDVKTQPSTNVRSNSGVQSTQSLSQVQVDNDLFVDKLVSVKLSIKILSRIPKGARFDAANALSDVIDACVADNTPSSWERLLSFPALCFQVPSKTDGKQLSLSTQVKRNIKAFLDKSISIETLQTSRSFDHKVTGNRGCDVKQIAKKVEAKLSEGDVKGAVRILSSEESFAPHDDDTFKDLLRMHPEVSEPPTFPDEQEESSLIPLLTTEAEVKAAVLSFPAGSAGGLDSLKPQHLKDLLSFSAGVAGVRLNVSLTKICNLMLRGEVPASICPILYGASLCALKKKNGGIRPIAIGCTLRRLVAKLCCCLLSSKVAPNLQPHQLGFGVKGGAEAAAHALRRYLDFPHNNPRVILKIDFKNAFNSLNRDSILRTVLTQSPEIYAFVKQCYKLPSHLCFGNKLLSSCRGLQQGDPLGSALFSMVVLPVTVSMSSELNIWFLDDATIADSPEVVMRDFNILSSSSLKLGLSVNPHKCELLTVGDTELSPEITNDFLLAVPGLRFPAPSEASLLGAPLNDSALEECLDSKTSTLQLISDRLSSLSAHCAYHILKNSQGIPKLSYILRCSPAWKATASLEKFDGVLKSAIESITNNSLSEHAFEQSSWPVSKGGLGIRQAKKIALPAFLASSHSVSGMVAKLLPEFVFESNNEILAEGTSRWCLLPEHVLPPSSELHSQKAWEKIDVSYSCKKLFELATESKDKARLLGVSSSEAGAFLNAIPSASIGTKLEDDSFRIAVALRLGSDICQRHVCKCGSPVDSSGTHGLSCRKSAGRIARHVAVNDLLKRALTSAGIPSTLEPAHLELNNNKRPDGMTLTPWTQGKSLVWDFTCSDNLAPTYLANSSTEPLYVASLAERNKKAKYAHLSETYVFTPVAAECLGGLSKDSLRLIYSIGRKITSQTGEKRATEFFLQRISVAIQRGNATSILGTFPTGASLEEDLSLL